MNLASRYIAKQSHVSTILACPILSITIAQAQLALEKDDVIAIIGNGLAEYMQHDGWVEAAIQIAQPVHNLRHSPAMPWKSAPATWGSPPHDPRP